MNIFIINAGQVWAHSGGTLNRSITNWSKKFFIDNNFNVRVTDINNDFEPLTEVENYKWADVIIYHLPIWWFQVPHKFKYYIDAVFDAGYHNGMYESDGRSSKNPAINYGKGGIMQGKKYMVTTSWNAPDTAFTLEGEFFEQTSVDKGVLYGFHKMNEFVGIKNIPGFHFHDVEKNATPERMSKYQQDYLMHLSEQFIPLEILI